MKKTFILSLICLLTSFGANAQSHYVANSRIERELNYICSTSIGAVPYSEEYAACRTFYDKQFYQYGIDVEYITPAEITVFLNRVNPIIHECRNQGLVSQLLWGCIERRENHHFNDWARHHPDYRHWDASHHKDWHQPHSEPSFNRKPEKHSEVRRPENKQPQRVEEFKNAPHRDLKHTPDILHENRQPGRDDRLFDMNGEAPQERKDPSRNFR